jgi:hypothetical protein
MFVRAMSFFVLWMLVAIVPLAAAECDVNIACGPKEWCDFSSDNTCGTAGKRGVCTARPEVCTAAYLPVCGCDAKTYSNSCVAHASGVSVAYAGTCRPSTGKAVPIPKSVLGYVSGICIQQISCGIKSGQMKEYATPCAARADGATNIVPKTGSSCPALQ